MAISFLPEQQEIVDGLIEGGHYADSESVVDHALRLPVEYEK